MASTALAPYASLSGAQKTAILVLAIGDTQGGSLLACLQEDEIREVSKAMVQLGPIPATVVEKLYEEFSDCLRSTTGVVGGIESTERVLSQNLPPDRVAQILEEIYGPAGRTMWDKLGNVDEGLLANYLKNEYPQTVAVILSKLRPDHAARILGKLPEAFATDVVMRLLRMETVQQDVLDGVERTLRSEFISNFAQTAPRDPHEQIATIFNNLDRKTELRFLGALEQTDQGAADRVRALMFTFQDLEKIPAQGIQVLLRTVQKDKIALALKGASAEMKDLFFKNLSERAGKMLREEMEALGPVRLLDVDDARAELVRIAKDLSAQGKIEIKQSGDEEVVY